MFWHVLSEVELTTKAVSHVPNTAGLPKKSQYLVPSPYLHWLRAGTSP